jgi:hypothetical protein
LALATHQLHPRPLVAPIHLAELLHLRIGQSQPTPYYLSQSLLELSRERRLIACAELLLLLLTLQPIRTLCEYDRRRERSD